MEGSDVGGLFAGTGEVGRDLQAVDWTATPLGAPDTWPRSLQTVVRMVLTSRFSMWMAWGPQLTFFCNEAYRRDTLGSKYPWALGRPASEVWAEIWPDIGPRIETVMRTGKATWDEALLLFLERSGYPEETYHTFSYSPLTDDAGRVVGMLCVVSEETDRVIGERRMTILRDLGSDPTAIRTEDEVFAAVARHLGAEKRSLPFTVTYVFDGETPTARLACSTGIPAGHPAAPLVITATEKAPAWPVCELAEGVSVTVENSGDRFPDLPSGDWPEPPVRALAVPLPAQGQTTPYGFLVVGVNRYRPCDAAYRGFIDLVAGQVAAAIGSARAYEAERQRAERLAELDRAKTTFFTNVSHEFRTPLTLLLGPAEDALADKTDLLPWSQRERVEVMHRNAQRLLKLVNTLLDFSRLESGRLTARYVPVDLSRYTADLASTFHAAIERVALTLTVDCTPPVLQPVYVDRDMWAKIVLNLLSNALKFTFTGGITVRVTAAAGFAELAVSDTGIGIDAAEQGHLFERFHRVTGARSRTYEGSGIGLALVSELAALHGGTVAVDSAPGTGSTFTVRVPFGAEHLPAEQLAEEGAAGSSQADRQAEGYLAEAMRWLDGAGHPSEAAFGGPHVTAEGEDGRPLVLVVDDNSDMRDYVARLLSDHYNVDVAADGAAGFEMARVRPPDLVLTDVMMPQLDGFGLLSALRADPLTAHVPVVMLSARAGEEATVEGLEAGADDYLVKPFAARELMARVRANLELDRSRRNSEELQRRQVLLDQAQRLARVGSWELDVATGGILASEEFVRQVQLSAEDLRHRGFEWGVEQRVHPDDAERVRAAVSAAMSGEPLDVELRLVQPDGTVRTFRTLGELERDASGTPVRLRGSNQDITEQRRAEQALATVAAGQEAALREHRIADELQRSLLPGLSFEPDHLRVATYYRAGVEGTQVGGDWYDVIELGAGRTALVMGDVMGRGVRAAAVMGQLRAAIRAYARLDLPAADVLEFLDGVVRDLGDDQIVTCIYAVYDPGDRTLSFANAGHLPPLLRLPGKAVQRLTRGAGPPLGAGPLTLPEHRVELPPGALLALYTDGLVERRDSDLDTGIDALAAELGEATRAIHDGTPDTLVNVLLPDGPDDDVAVLLAQVHDDGRPARSASQLIPSEEEAVQHARRFVSARLAEWGTPLGLVDGIVLLVSELVTNAVIHGRPPIELRLRCTDEHVVLEVRDHATYLPRRLRPTPEDEHGRGLQLVALLADRWGTRPVPDGKAVWCVFSLDHEQPAPGGTTVG
ncbi:MAG: SpoIIE family protein phosphatase [Actinomycetes bacterium]